MAAEQVRGVGDLVQAVVALLEADHLVGGAVAVLHRAQQPQAGVPVALEGEHRVDHVLEGARPGDRALLGGLADQQQRHPAGLGHPGQHGGDLLHLAHPAGPALHRAGRHRLDAVHDQQHRVVRLDVAQHVRRGRSRRRAGCPGWSPRSGAPGRRSARRSPRRRRRAPPGPGAAVRPGSATEPEQGGLADPGLAGEQHDLPGDQATAEDPVELAQAGQLAGDRLRGDGGEAAGRARRGDAGRRGAQAGRRRRGHGGLDRVVLTAARAVADPLQQRRAAGGADPGGALRHGQGPSGCRGMGRL